MKNNFFKKARNISHALFERRPVLHFVDVDELYRDTLYLSVDKPWALENGTFVALEYRYEFAKAYLDSAQEFNYKDTEYYRFLKKTESKNFTGLYDGSRGYAMANASCICERYEALIDLVLKNIRIYNTLNARNLCPSFYAMLDDIIAFERKHKKQVFYFAEHRYVRQKENQRYEASSEQIRAEFHKQLVGHYIPSAVRRKNFLVLKNGSHRLALFKALREQGLFTNLFPVYIIG